MAAIDKPINLLQQHKFKKHKSIILYKQCASKEIVEVVHQRSTLLANFYLLAGQPVNTHYC
jgi:hypothetical protein